MEAKLSSRGEAVLSKTQQSQQVSHFLGRLRHHSMETYEHSLRVGHLSIELALRNKLKSMEIQQVAYGAVLHDIGKLMVDRDILHHSGSLTDEEKSILDRHPRYGSRILKQVKLPITQAIVLGHHEYKSQPYPRKNNERRTTSHGSEERRMSDPRIQFIVQMVAVADITDALLEVRSYKERLTLSEVEAVLYQDFHGDKRLIDQVLSLFDPSRVTCPIP